MSEVKVNKLTPKTACGTVTLGDSGDTFTIPSGVTITNAGTATGFGATGAVSWSTGSIKTTGFTAVSGLGYFCNTTSGGFTVNLPASPSAGDVVGVADYAKTFDTGNLILGRNSENIGGTAANATLSVEGAAVTLVYVDGTKGWIVTDSGNQTDAPAPLYVSGSGGTPATSGNFKIHTFTGPGTFTVSCGGNPTGSTQIDYLIIGGGGGGGGGYNSPANRAGGAGGAGGYRETNGTASGCYTTSPLGTTPTTVPGVTVTASPGSYPISVGGGGVGGHAPAVAPQVAANGCSSSAFCITSAGGGFGGSSYTPSPRSNGNGGGSGGGGSAGGAGCGCGGPGNQPPVTPPQGNDGGGNGTGPDFGGHGGGGATVAGTPQCNPGPTVNGGPGGAGATSCITASPVARAGGGGGGAGTGTGGAGGTGNPGGAGGNFPNVDGGAGTPTTGGGGGGGAAGSGTIGGGGGGGIVIIRYRFQ